MSILFINNIDLGQNELQNARIQNLGVDPGSPVEGQIWINTASHKLKWFDGTASISPIDRASHQGTQAFSTITSTPTTLAGYGILDAVDSSTYTTALALKSPLASPTFTGSVTIPTATAGNSSTLAASTAFVQGELTTLIGGAPGTLNTLNELATAINNDASYASTLTTALALKAPLSSPALTGVPTAPTASAAANSTQVATTAYVDAAVGSGAVVHKYSTTIGDSTSTSIVVTHSLGTRDVVVDVSAAATPWNQVICEVQKTSTSTATLIFAVAPATSALRVTIVG